MASTYVNDLRLNELGTGDGSGTWGTTTNTNFELIAESLSFGTEAITTNADTHTSTIADGAADPARSIYIKYTGTLDSACTITIAPNTISRLHFIENGTSGSQNIIISQGSGANVTIPPGDVKVVYLDGAGSGAAVVDAFASLSVVDLKVQDDLLLNSDSAVLSIGADADLKITHDGTNGDFESAGNLTFDVAGDINLDADGGEIFFQDGGTSVAYFGNSSTDLLIGVANQDKDLYIQGNDGGSTINALKLDMSAAGEATFNAGASFSGNVGIGTTTVDSLLHLQNSDATTYSATATDGQVGVGPTLYLENPANSNTTVGGQIVFGMRSTESQARIGATGGANPALVFGTNDAERLRIDSSGNVGIGGTPSYPLHVQAGSNSAVVRITNTGSADANVNAILQLATATNVVQLLLNEVNNYSQFTHSGDLATHYDDVNIHIFRTKAGVEKARIQETGDVNSNHKNPDGSFTGIFSNYTGVALADDASFAISTTGTAGGGILAIYEHGSGQSAVFHFGYNRSTLISGSTDVFSTSDTDGRSCAIASGHTLTIKNRRGSTVTYSTCMNTAGLG